MNQTASLLSQIDPVTQRRKALAKVYTLLIKLAEEKEEKTTTTTKANEKPALLKPNIPQGQ
jgi:hypothetical protein